ncbi:hypothetical protein TorRG33x02_085390 [Trema orientale]|uniref:Uncharacterized protein n=1 Tax=Trema orientale TaxID=63057 RepID=A0A2P5FD40_TREOI|nr:hypothetical protein TorRG33x02_085390 [Trema orientale]
MGSHYSITSQSISYVRSLGIYGRVEAALNWATRRLNLDYIYGQPDSIFYSRFHVSCDISVLGRAVFVWLGQQLFGIRNRLFEELLGVGDTLVEHLMVLILAWLLA